MLDIKLDFGPWEPIFEGKAYGHMVEIIANRENFYLVFIYEEIQGKKVGAIIEGYKALVCKGNMEAFINTFPKPCTGILKTLGDKTQKVFFISFDPLYLDFSEEDYVKQLDHLLEKNIESTSTIIDLARASSVELRELAQSSVKDYFQIVGDPFMMHVLLSPKRSSGLTKLDLKDALPEEKAAKIQLGLTKNREIVFEKTRNLYRSSITGTDEKAVEYGLYIIAENLLLEGKQVLIFDTDNYFEGLSRPSKNDIALKEYLVEYEPAGFPTKKIKPKSEMQVSLKDMNIHILLDIFGVFDEGLEKGLMALDPALTYDTPKELQAVIAKNSSLNEFQKLKTERLLAIIDNSCKGLFGKNLNASELIKKWTGSLGRAILIDTRSLSAQERLIFTASALNFFTKAAKTEGIHDTAIIIPHADMLAENKLIDVELLDMEGAGFGLILGTEKPVPEDLEKSMQTTMTVVAGRDLAVSTYNSPSYRVNLRPSISGDVKYQ